MKTIENLLREVQQRIAQIRKELEPLTNLEQMYLIQLGLNEDPKEAIEPGAAQNIPELSLYPLKGGIKEKFLFLDSQSPRGWNVIGRSVVVESIEKDQSKKTLEYISQSLKPLVSQGVYVRCRFNKANRYTFYFKPEWLEKIGEGQYRIKAEHMPTDKYFIEIPEDKRTPGKTEWFDSSTSK